MITTNVHNFIGKAATSRFRTGCVSIRLFQTMNNQTYNNNNNNQNQNFQAWIRNIYCQVYSSVISCCAPLVIHSVLYCMLTSLCVLQVWFKNRRARRKRQSSGSKAKAPSPQHSAGADKFFTSFLWGGFACAEGQPVLTLSGEAWIIRNC